ncbi:MAG: LytTR family DNA-binding domain-containing protein [Oscillospiraceae bacterium]|nr:LytTR family DNA-binding domain-containing protein [Oscillospiraceae bacterium]
MRIAICDDEQIFRDDLKNAVYSYSNVHRLEIVVDEFYGGEYLLESKEKYDIVLLDYKMQGLDGLATARELREKNVNVTIIFLTSFPHFVYESFEVGTFRFFEKPLDVSKLHRAFDDYFRMFGNNYPLPLKIDRETRIIETNDIVFLEADNKTCYIHLAREKLRCAKTMAYIGRLMPKNNFYKINKAFIVNMNYIKRYDNEFIYFKNRERAHISRKYLTSFKSAYMDYSKSQMV